MPSVQERRAPFAVGLVMEPAGGSGSVPVGVGRPSVRAWSRLLCSAEVTDAQVLFGYGVPAAVRRQVDAIADELRMLVRVVSSTGLRR